MTGLTTLTDEELRILGAEAMGWVMIPSRPGYWVPPEPDERFPHGWGRAKFRSLKGLPDPLHDLNDAVALAEAWQKKSDKNLWWKLESPSKSTETWIVRIIEGSVWDGQAEADSPARALALAVLAAMEVEK